MLSVIIVIAIIVLSVILAAIGAYVVIHSSDEKDETKRIKKADLNKKTNKTNSR